MEKMAALDGLIEFGSAAESGSVSAAARVLGVSVAHVSRSVANLEHRLGLQLIQRTSRRSVLTEAGRLYHASCRSLLDGLDEAREALRQGQNELRGIISPSKPLISRRRAGTDGGETFMWKAPQPRTSKSCARSRSTDVSTSSGTLSIAAA